jgi:hypothetical protein
MRVRAFLLAALVALFGLSLMSSALATDPYGYPPPCTGSACPPPQGCDQVVGTVCVNPSPVEGNYDPNQTGPTMVTGPLTGGEVIVFPHSIPVPGVVRLDENPPDPTHLGMPTGGKSQTFSVLSQWFDVTFRATQGVFNPAGPWNPPVQVIFPLPASAATLKPSAIAVFSHAAAWRRIEELEKGTTLPAKQADGFYLTGSGASRMVHVLTRHLTVFAAFKVTISNPAKSATVVRFSRARSCTRRATVRVRIHQRGAARVTQATVRAGGRAARVVRGAALRRAIRLRHLPRGRFTVRVTLRRSDGRTLTVRRTYRGCAG